VKAKSKKKGGEKWLGNKLNKNDPYMILDYYKDWDSDKAPVMMILDNSDDNPGKIESEDEKKLAYLWNKYQKSK